MGLGRRDPAGDLVERAERRAPPRCLGAPNYLHDFPAKPKPQVYASGQSDALEICGDGQPASDRRSGWTIEHNLIERHHGGYGVIDILCSGTTVRENTMLKSPGGVRPATWLLQPAIRELDRGCRRQRHPWWLPAGVGQPPRPSQRRWLPDLLVGLVLTTGTVPWNYVGPPRLPDGTPAHQAAYKVLVAGNSAPRLEIGLQRSPAFKYAVRETIVERQVGPIVRGVEQATIVRPHTTMTIPAAVRLNPDSVGPSGSMGAADDATDARVGSAENLTPEACSEAS